MKDNKIHITSEDGFIPLVQPTAFQLPSSVAGSMLIHSLTTTWTLHPRQRNAEGAIEL